MNINKEKIWILLYILFAKNLPISYHCKPAKILRGWFARKILKEVGNEINIEHGAAFNGECSIGNKSGIGVHCELNGSVCIGSNVMMGPEVVIYTQNHATMRTDISMREQEYNRVETVIIEDDVWIGRRVIILPGVRIGKGSVLGAGTVIARDIPSYSVVVGNPAKVVKNRKVSLVDKI